MVLTVPSSPTRESNVDSGDVVSSRIRQLEQDSRQLEQYITG